jgi:hypothetical protein
LRRYRVRTLSHRQRLPRVGLDIAGHAVAVELVLADAVVDLAEPADPSAEIVGREPLDQGLQARAPVAAHMRDDGLRLQGIGHVVGSAVGQGDLVGSLGQPPGGVEVADLPHDVGAQASETALLGRVRLQPVGGVQVQRGRVGLVMHQQRRRALTVQPARGRRIGRSRERMLEGHVGRLRVACLRAQVADPFPQLGRQLGFGRVVAPDLLVQPLRLWARLHAQFGIQQLTQALVHAPGLVPPPGHCMQPHQPGVVLLAQRFGGDQTLHDPRGVVSLDLSRGCRNR